MNQQLKERISDQMAVAMDVLNDLADLLHDTPLGRKQVRSEIMGGPINGQLYDVVSDLQHILDTLYQKEF